MSDDLIRLVGEKAEGNPLFAEEIANYLASERATVSQGNLQRLPVTLENILMARVDRLEEQSRALLETASVIGRDFSLELLGTAAEVNGTLVTLVDDLAHQELILLDTRGEECRFKHGLIQDAVYGSLLKARREHLHTRVAGAIERTRADRLGEVADTLAFHYLRTPLANKAAQYAELAGEKSLRVYSLAEAEQRFLQAVDLCNASPGCAGDAFLLNTLLKLARVYYHQVNFVSLIERLEPYLPVAERLEDRRLLARFLFELGYAYVFSGRGDRGRALLERALSLGEEIGDDESIGYACLGLTWQYRCWEPANDGSRDTVQRLADRAIKIGTDLRDTWLTSKALVVLALDYLMRGRPRVSREYCARLFELSSTTGDPRPRAMGLWALAYLNGFSFEYEEAIANADEALQISLSPIDRLNAQGAKALALSMVDRVGEALSLLDNVHSRLMAGRCLPPLHGLDLGYGAAILLGGEMSKGVRWIQEAMRRFAEQGYELGPVLGHLYLGEIYLRITLGEDKPPLPVLLRNFGFVMTKVPVAAGSARRHLTEAISGFHRLDAPALRARCLYDLGLLHKAKQKPVQARVCLQEAVLIAESVGAQAIVDRACTCLNSLEL